MAMVDYPYATDFIANLPAWPVNEACTQGSLAEASQATYSQLYGMSAAAQVYLNYTGEMLCLNTSTTDMEGIDDNGWNVLSCNEMPMPMSSGANSMFPPSTWDNAAYNTSCSTQFSI